MADWGALETSLTGGEAGDHGAGLRFIRERLWKVTTWCQFSVSEFGFLGGSGVSGPPRNPYLHLALAAAHKARSRKC
jgi:hypothetical protein